MFSELYGFKLSFTSRRCSFLGASEETWPGDVDACSHCGVRADCGKQNGSEFVVDFPLADSKAAIELFADDGDGLDV